MSMDTSKIQTAIDQASEADKMRIRIANMHHMEFLEKTLHEFGGSPDNPLGIKTWNDVCDTRFLEAGHTNTSFMDCTCVENKDITG